MDQPVIWGAPQAERVDAARNRLHLGRSYIGLEGSYGFGRDRNSIIRW